MENEMQMSFTEEERASVSEAIKELADREGYLIIESAEVKEGKYSKDRTIFGIPVYGGHSLYTVIESRDYAQTLWEIEKEEDGSYSLGKETEYSIGDGGPFNYLTLWNMLTQMIPNVNPKKEKGLLEEAKKRIFEILKDILPERIQKFTAHCLLRVQMASTSKELEIAVFSILRFLDEEGFDSDDICMYDPEGRICEEKCIFNI